MLFSSRPVVNVLDFCWRIGILTFSLVRFLLVPFLPVFVARVRVHPGLPFRYLPEVVILPGDGCTCSGHLRGHVLLRDGVDAVPECIPQLLDICCPWYVFQLCWKHHQKLYMALNDISKGMDFNQRFSRFGVQKICKRTGRYPSDCVVWSKVGMLATCMWPSTTSPLKVRYYYVQYSYILYISLPLPPQTRISVLF